MHEGLWQQVVGLEGEETCRRALCEYDSGRDCYVVRFLGDDYEVNVGEKGVLLLKSGCEDEAAGFLEQLCVLSYLISAKDVPLCGKLVKGEALPSGQFFFRGIHTLPTEKLEEAFGGNPRLLYAAKSIPGAQKRDFGDASIELLVLPRIPVTFVVWAADEEFGARASILFDKTACEQLPLDALGTAVNLAVKAVIAAVGKNN